MFRFSNKSLFEQPSGTDYVRKPRFDCSKLVSQHVEDLLLLVSDKAFDCFHSLYQNSSRSALHVATAKPLTRTCVVGDKMGCGIRKQAPDHNNQSVLFGGPQCKLEVYFTLNGEEVRIMKQGFQTLRLF